MKLIDLLVKFGGLALIFQWLRSGVIWFAPFHLLFLGFSRKSLEIFRLSSEFLVQKKLRRRYDYVWNSIESVEFDSSTSELTKTIWICWLQGIDSAPLVVKRCYQSVCEQLSDWNITVITFDNYDDYTELPSYIVEKWKNGKITNTHFSDILRSELLVRHGGLWLDATVFCTSGNLPDYIISSNLFMYQMLKPGSDGHSIKLSSWLIYTRCNHPVLYATRAFLFEYWKGKNRLDDYFLFHHFMSISLDFYSDEWMKIPKVPNSIPHILLLQFFDEYDDSVFNHVKRMTPFHKLSYKCDSDDFEKCNTFYDVLINRLPSMN